MNVFDVMKLALPPASEIVAGAAGSGTTVTWATTFRSRPPAFDHLEGGEMVLLSLAAVRVVDSALSLARIITNLRDRRISAIAVAGAVDVEAREAADEAALPVIALPADADLHGLERSVIGLLVNKEAELQARAGQIQRQLTQVAMQGRGLAGIARELLRLTGKSVSIRDARLEVLASSGQDSGISSGQRKALLAALKNPVLAGHEPEAQRLTGESGESGCWAAVIAVNNRPRGLVLLAGAESELSELDGLAAVRAATVCAVEMVKERAVVEAETKIQGDVVRELLHGNPTNEASMLARAAHMEWDVASSQAVCVLEAGRPEEGTLAALRKILARRGIRPLVAAWDGQAAFVYPLPATSTPSQWRGAAEEIRSEVAAESGGRTISAGLGRQGAGLRGLQQSFVEAQQALRAGSRLFGPGALVAFADLGSYRLLAQLHGTPELAAFEREILSDLIDYDQRSGSHLIETLGAFFASNGNLSKTSELLFVHRNTLMYRLNRIQEITGLSLDDAETRFDLQLALKMHRVARGAGAPARS